MHKPFIARPSKHDIALLPVFVGLRPDQIVIVRSDAQMDDALRAMQDAGQVGFDTESKPTFAPGEAGTGPHVVQFAVRDRGYVVQVAGTPPLDFLKAVIESDTIVKVGFGLSSDRPQLERKLGIRLGRTVELTKALRYLGYKDDLGAKAAVAIVLGRRMEKSNAVKTSSWAAPVLQPKQLLYAANDAYAALCVFEAIPSPMPDE
jgi:ribonuclease D